MKIKIGKLMRDNTAYGNKYWIQIEDNTLTSNTDLENLVNKSVAVVVDEVSAIDNLIQEVEIK